MLLRKKMENQKWFSERVSFLTCQATLTSISDNVYHLSFRTFAFANKLPLYLQYLRSYKNISKLKKQTHDSSNV